VECDGQREDRTRLVGVAVASPGSPPTYVPLAHRYLSAPPQLSVEDLRPLAEVWGDPAVRVVCHDAKAVYKAMAAIGMPIAGVAEDTMLAAYLLDSSSDDHALERVVREATGLELPPHKALVGSGRGAIGFEAVAVEDAARWTGRAASSILAAADVLTARLDQTRLGDLWRDLELPLAHLLARMERTGVLIDVAHLRGLSERMAGELARLEARIQELAGE